MVIGEEKEGRVNSCPDMGSYEATRCNERELIEINRPEVPIIGAIWKIEIPGNTLGPLIFVLGC